MPTQQFTKPYNHATSRYSDDSTPIQRANRKRILADYAFQCRLRDDALFEAVVRQVETVRDLEYIKKRTAELAKERGWK